LIVLDASALLALVQSEPGAETIADAIGTAFASTVNVAEALAKLRRYDLDADLILRDWLALGLVTIPATLEHARVSASLWPYGKPLGLSLGDRICAATAMIEGAEILTSDERLSRLQAGVKITMIR
jgi:PIN domain nuclease of toxin-antitoxin system